MQSSTAQQLIHCPNCRQAMDVAPITVIHDDAPELGFLYQGSLNLIACSRCEVKFHLDIPLVYRDDGRPYLVFLLPTKERDDIDGAIASMADLYEHMFSDLGRHERPVARLTINRRDFIEKIALHRYGYDDRVIEYIKYQLFQHSKGLDAHAMDLLYDFGSSTPDTIMFLAFHRANGQPEYSLGFPVSDYHNLMRYLLGPGGMEDRLTSMFRSYYVHVADLL